MLAALMTSAQRYLGRDLFNKRHLIISNKEQFRSFVTLLRSGVYG